MKVGNENVDTALSLVGYDKDLEGAMKFVFGSSFVASDLNSAKKVYLLFGLQFSIILQDIFGIYLVLKIMTDSNSEGISGLVKLF